MAKEFCVDYELHESSEYANRKVYDVKVKTGKDIFAREVELDDIDGYTKALKDLGYVRTFRASLSLSGKVCDWW